jgi:hypothetical protein
VADQSGRPETVDPETRSSGDVASPKPWHGGYLPTKRHELFMYVALPVLLFVGSSVPAWIGTIFTIKAYVPPTHTTTTAPPGTPQQLVPAPQPASRSLPVAQPVKTPVVEKPALPEPSRRLTAITATKIRIDRSPYSGAVGSLLPGSIVTLAADDAGGRWRHVIGGNPGETAVEGWVDNNDFENALVESWK